MRIHLPRGGCWPRRLSLAWNIAVLTITAFVSAVWANIWVDSLRDYRPPLAQLDATASDAPAGPALTEGLVLVLLEGVPADYLDRTPALAGISAAHVRMTGPLSSYTPASGWITLISGASPRLAGAPLQGAADSVLWYARAETLFDVTADAGRQTALYGPVWWRGMVAAAKRSESVLFGSAGEPAALATLAEARRQLESQPPALTLVHVRWPDGSPTASLDDALRGLVRAVEPSRQTLLLAAAPARGTARLMAFGRGIRPGAYTGMRPADIAPTAAALLGVPAPARSEGTIFRALLAWDAEAEARSLAALAEVRWKLAEAYLAGMGASLDVGPLLGEREAVRQAVEAGRWPAAREGAEKLLAVLDGLMREAYHRRVWGDRLWRLWLPIMYLAGAILMQGRAWRRKELPLAPALITVAAAGLPAVWLTLSRGTRILESFAGWQWVLAGLGALGTLAGLWGMWVLRRESWDIWERWRRAAGLVQLLAAIWGLPLAFLMWWQGLVVWWDLPAPAGAAAQAVLLTQLAGLCAGGLAGILAAPFLKS